MEHQEKLDATKIIQALAQKGLGVKRFVKSEQIIKNISILRPIDCGVNLIRVGGESDGGYIIPDDLKGISHCFSPGVSNIADFEKDLFESYGINSFLADYSVEEPPASLKGSDFEKKFISSKIGSAFTTLEDWIDRKSEEFKLEDLILQMDIEGSEYDAIISTSPMYLKMFRIIVVELHFIEEMIFDRFDFFGSTFRKLTKNHKVVHLHPNNCCGSLKFNGIEIPRVLEVTLIRSDRVRRIGERSDFPHRLDKKNVANNPDLYLPEVWYKEI